MRKVRRAVTGLADSQLSLHGLELKIGWGKPSAVAPAVAMAVAQSGASRNVYLGNLPASTTEQDLRDDLQRFGFIDQVKIGASTRSSRR